MKPRTAWRLLRLPLIPLALYLALHPIAAALSARHGFGSPDGVSPVYLTVTLALLTLRFVLLVVVPAVLTYRVVVYALTHFLADPDQPGKLPAAQSSRGGQGRAPAAATGQDAQI
ncbi:hypothetical protein [Nocardia sp. XZ_19_385]|uniref:hypothetical protein n=1 Tax=Nocardia sp. XZ_19_385 TaxID=2769488 RepID=UPI00188F88D4|nr:hypothetical protein [Nocardia sp. XZ_19_385]